MNNLTKISVLLLVILLSISSWSYGQQKPQPDYLNQKTNTLDVIKLTSKPYHLKKSVFFKENKRHLRIAARLSEGDIDKFSKLVMVLIPKDQRLDYYSWEDLYKASRLLTFSGKIEELPSFL